MMEWHFKTIVCCRLEMVPGYWTLAWSKGRQDWGGNRREFGTSCLGSYAIEDIQVNGWLPCPDKSIKRNMLWSRDYLTVHIDWDTAALPSHSYSNIVLILLGRHWRQDAMSSLYIHLAERKTLSLLKHTKSSLYLFVSYVIRDIHQ